MEQERIDGGHTRKNARQAQINGLWGRAGALALLLLSACGTPSLTKVGQLQYQAQSYQVYQRTTRDSASRTINSVSYFVRIRRKNTVCPEPTLLSCQWTLEKMLNKRG